MTDNRGGRWPSAPTPSPDIRPPECFESEDVYKWLLAERDWLLGPVALAQHQIRINEGVFEHDAVQLACDEGHPPVFDE